jgi:hypothetical protein
MIVGLLIERVLCERGQQGFQSSIEDPPIGNQSAMNRLKIINSASLFP